MRQVIYSKYSNERDRKFSIRTDICQDKEKRWIEKVAATPEAVPHVKNLIRWHRELAETFSGIGLAFNECEETEKGVKLAYVKAQSLEEYLDEKLDQGLEEDAYRRLMDYLGFLQEIHARKSFEVTEEFERVFGKADLPEGLMCAEISDIDLVCANLLLAQPATIIDYEWTFDFPIPGNFVVYRALHYYVDTHSKRQRLNRYKPYQELGISDQELKAYREMEIHFQRYITGSHVPMREMYKDISPGVKEIKVLMGENLQVYESFGTGFEEHNSSFYPIREERVQVKVPVPEGADYLRVDPGSCACAVKIHKLNFQPGDIPAQYYCENGWACGPWLYIAKDDPNLTNIPVPEGVQELEIDLEVHPVEAGFLEGMAKRFQEEEEEIRNLREQNQQQSRRIQEMENTKVWRAYQRYQGMRGKESKNKERKQ